VQIRDKIKTEDRQILEKSNLVKKIKNSPHYQHLEDNDIKKISGDKWDMIDTFQKHLLYYALFDFSLQLIYQLPIFEPHGNHENIGLRKIWTTYQPEDSDGHFSLESLSIKRFMESIMYPKQYGDITGL
jgi:hypothetical protein